MGGAIERMNLEEALELIAEQKKQAYLHSKSYLELLEEIVDDLECLDDQALTNSELILKYNKKLWSQKK